jgi:spermidine synthase
MARHYTRLLIFIFGGSVLAPLVTYAATRFMRQLLIDPEGHWMRFAMMGLIRLKFLSLIVLAVLATVAVSRMLLRLEPKIETIARKQAEFLSSLAPEYVGAAIVGSAALSLFFELEIIRWQGTVFEFFAFYKNFSLLACFAGLGLGYALAGRKHIPLLFTIPLLCWQFLLMIGMRYGMGEHFQSLTVMPFAEQLSMGIPTAKKWYYAIQIYFMLAVVFAITAGMFIPVGQLCGALMERKEKLRAYGLNLLGSIIGVLLIFIFSAFWTPPIVWFLPTLGGLLLFNIRLRPVLLVVGGSAILALGILAWPVNSMWPRVYSPYQVLEFGHADSGFLMIRAAGHYYQRIHDLSAANHNLESDGNLKAIRNYYELPYKAFGHPKDVAIVGAGTGNDVAAALRSGAANVDAIEIDPVIQMAGREAHPERPYSDPRVRAVVNDARSFLRGTDRVYDMVVYGLLDSHTLLSHASSVRLDSFVYTVEGLREARSRLRPNGLISLSFTVLSPELGHKIYLMLQKVFDGRPPICVRSTYDSAVIFLATSDPSFEIPPSVLQTAGLTDAGAMYGNPALRADVSTDDWPFFYMPRRVYPVSYLAMVALVLFLSLLLVAGFSDGRTRISHVPFFLLGVGFMLIETKGITELGLTFGNSWQVIGVAIIGVMLMAFLANYFVQLWTVRKVSICYVLLLASLFLGWFVAGHGGLPSTWAGRAGTAVLLTCPIFFSGMVFSTLLRSSGEISGMMSANLFGAMCGGLVEYNSMYFGIRALYVIAAGLYLGAFLWGLGRKGAEGIPGVSVQSAQ